MNNQPPEMSEAEVKDINFQRRRDVLKFGLGGLACLLVPSLRPDIRALAQTNLPEKTPNPNAVDRHGALVEDHQKYSSAITSFDLIPVVPTEWYSPEQQIKAGVDYLVQLGKALKENPQVNPVVSEFLNYGENYPVAIPADWHISDIINTFDHEIQSGKTQIIYDEKLEYLMGTQSYFSYNEETDDWERKSIIRISKEWVRAGRFYETSVYENEDGQTQTAEYYYRFNTNTETGILLGHEFLHALQDELLMQHVARTLKTDADLQQRIKHDPNAFLAEVKRVEQEIRTSLEEKFGKDIKYREAQANTVHYMMLYCLNQLNGSDHFPGTTMIDPGSVQVEMVKKTNQSYINMYHEFVRIVLNDEDETKKKNSLDPDWLAYH